MNTVERTRFTTPPLGLLDVFASGYDQRSRIPVLLISAASEKTRSGWTSSQMAFLNEVGNARDIRRPYIGPEISLDPDDQASVEAAVDAIVEWRTFALSATADGSADTRIRVDDWQALRPEVHAALAHAAKSTGGPSAPPSSALFAGSRHTLWRNVGAVDGPRRDFPSDQRLVPDSLKLLHLSAERHRDYRAAVDAAKRLYDAGVQRTDIRRHLTVFGYQNANGIVGSWDRRGHLDEILGRIR